MGFETDYDLIILHGLGVEGQAALPWILDKSSAQIILIDGLEKTEKLTKLNKQRLKGLTEEAFLENLSEHSENTLYLRSPGIPPSNIVFQKIRSLEINHTTPTGLWVSSTQTKQTITITGTKGKSSTASLTTQILNWLNLPAVTLGNIGATPFSVKNTEEQICVLELSSYMMHDIMPYSGLHVITSLYKEHTDWHGSEAAYRNDKLRPFLEKWSIDGLMPDEINSILPQGATKNSLEDFVIASHGHLSFASSELQLDAASLNEIFKAPSMLLALRAAVAIILKSRLATETEIIGTLNKHLPSWNGLEARQEIIPSRDGILWVNDTLATVPEATMSALKRWEGKTIHLLLGGADRGQDYSKFLDYCETQSGLHLYTHSEIAAKIISEKKVISTHESLESMIEAAKKTAVAGDIILFSPAAPSAPPFANFKQRSQVFSSFTG